MAKLDKSKYTKQEFKQLKLQRRIEKSNAELVEAPPPPINTGIKTAFIIGNGISRRPINLEKLKSYGKIYGCNALYREFEPDYLVAVDVKMVLEISRNGFQNKHQVWTNPNKAYQNISGLNLFQPSKGWSSGPTALWLASQHNYDRIYILGFDYAGIDDGKKVNNLYAGTQNYKKQHESATYYGNWVRQTRTVIYENPKIKFYRVIASDNFMPKELNNFENLETLTVNKFMKIFNNF